MQTQQIAAQIEKFIEKSFGFDQARKPERGQSLLDFGVVDSTGMLQLVPFPVETFSIKIEEEGLVPANLDSIDNTAAFVAGKLGR